MQVKLAIPAVAVAVLAVAALEAVAGTVAQMVPRTVVAAVLAPIYVYAQKSTLF